jgi:hypothetical protein
MTDTSVGRNFDKHPRKPFQATIPGLVFLLCFVIPAMASTPLALQITKTNTSWPVILKVSGPPGSNVLVQSSADLVHWETETFVTCNGQVAVQPSSSWSSATRFYRLATSSMFSSNAMLKGVVRYSGPRPVPASVSYTAPDGSTYKVAQAYPGWCVFYADPTASFASVSNAVRNLGGAIRAALPAAGIYEAQVSGNFAQFLSGLYSQDWFIDGGPAGPASLGSASTEVAVLDWDDPDGSGVCSRMHMSDVGLLAGRRRPFDAYDANDPKLVDVHDRATELPAEALARMVSAYEARKHVTINLSLQSPSSGAALSSDQSNCTDDDCASIRRDQKLFYQGFLQMLDQTLTKQPAVADNALLVVIAGNAGVGLDNELAELKEQYPAAFNRMVIVGGTDEQGKIAKHYNHLNDNSVPNMVYARADNVWPVGCDGTSYAAPEVSSALDAIWLRATNATSAQLLKAFHRTLATTATNNVIPFDAKGKVTTNFINQVVQAIADLPPDITPKKADLPTIGGCAGGSASATFSITAPNDVSWSISWTGLHPSIGTHSVSPSAGKGPATVTFTATVLPQKPNFSCSDTYSLTYGDQLSVTFSTGQQYWVSVNYTYLAVW